MKNGCFFAWLKKRALSLFASSLRVSLFASCLLVCPSPQAGGGGGSFTGSDDDSDSDSDDDSDDDEPNRKAVDAAAGNVSPEWCYVV
jgi:hypothetical protein